MPVLLPSSLATQKQEQVVRWGGGEGGKYLNILNYIMSKSVYNKKDKSMENFLLLFLSLFLITHTLFHLPLLLNSRTITTIALPLLSRSILGGKTIWVSFCLFYFWFLIRPKSKILEKSLASSCSISMDTHTFNETVYFFGDACLISRTMGAGEWM